MHTKIATAAALILISGCGFTTQPLPTDKDAGQHNRDDAGTQPTFDAGGPNTTAWKPEDGFVVHEWGTLTSVVATDGTLLPGLHHEEEDLPGFVADRLALHQSQPSVVMKMETPVTYFYAPARLQVSAKVEFPNGLFTQWFPYVKSTAPAVYFQMDPNAESVDPWQVANATPAQCASRYQGPFEKGVLDWGSFTVLAPSERPALAGPLGNTTWSFARQVQANTLEISNVDSPTPDHEQFLFYRGLGNFGLPLKAQVAGTLATFTNTDPTNAMGKVVLMRVEKSHAGFSLLGDVAAGGTLSGELPAATLTHADFVAQLKAALKSALVADGLYTDEAQAMVDTWERSYFLTPGVRALYLLPRAHIDSVIPLTVKPAPAASRRTMVIRLELLTPAEETEHAQWLTLLSSPPTAATARAAFLGLGRFAEPHLTWAVQHAKSAGEKSAGEALLNEVRGTRRWAPTALE